MSADERLVGLLTALGGMVIAIAPFLAAYWVVYPLNTLAKTNEQPIKFGIGDFLALFVMYQVPLSLVFAAMPKVARTSQNQAGLAVIVFLMTAILWALGVSELSRAGIHSFKHRFLFVTVVMPVAFIVAPLTISLIGSALMFGANPQELPPIVDCPRFPLLLLLLVLAIWGCGQYTRWLECRLENQMSNSVPDNS
jgi:hypothetical protein